MKKLILFLLASDLFFATVVASANPNIEARCVAAAYQVGYGSAPEDKVWATPVGPGSDTYKVTVMQNDRVFGCCFVVMVCGPANNYTVEPKPWACGQTTACKL